MVATRSRLPSSERQGRLSAAQRATLRKDVPERHRKREPDSSVASLRQSQLHGELQSFPEGAGAVPTGKVSALLGRGDLRVQGHAEQLVGVQSDDIWLRVDAIIILFHDLIDCKKTVFSS